MKALVGAFNQEKALVGAFSVIVQPIVEPMDRFTALIIIFAGFANFRTWPLMSTHYWGEDPRGEWKLVIVNGGDRSAYVGGWRLIVYGTETEHNTSS